MTVEIVPGRASYSYPEYASDGENTVAEIHAINVPPIHQGKGRGEKMARAMLSALRDMGVKKVIATNIAGKRAEEFWKYKVGFTEPNNVAKKRDLEGNEVSVSLYKVL